MGHTDICELLLAAGANIEQKEQVNIASNLEIEYTIMLLFNHAINSIA
jgi:hypothetical protein